MNRDQAHQATRNGSIAAYLSGALTLAMVTFATFSNLEGPLELFNDPALYFDAFIIFACAWGISRKSRFAAVLMFVYFLLSKIVISMEMGKASGIVVGLVFLYYFGKAVQGTFVHHRLERAENPSYKSTSKWAYIAGAPVIVIVAGLMVLAVLSSGGVVPAVGVEAGSKLPASQRTAMEANRIIEPGDRIEYFYAAGLTDLLEAGSVLTSDRVILYLHDENRELAVYEMYFEDVASVDVIEPGNFFNDAVYRINGHEPDVWLQIVLSTDKRGDIRFIEALRTRVATAQR